MFKYLIRISRTIGIGAVWMLINTFFAFQQGCAVVHEGISYANIIFYVFFLGSLSALIWLMFRMWK